MLVSRFLKQYFFLVGWQQAIIWGDGRAGLHGAAIFSAMCGACLLIYLWYSTQYEINREAHRILNEIEMHRRQAALFKLSPEARNG